LPRATYFNGEGPIPEDIVREQVKKMPIGDHTWLYYGMSYGPEHIRKYKLDIIDKEFKKIPGARRIDPATLPEDEYFGLGIELPLVFLISCRLGHG
jgi:hypothetical protein